MGEQRALASGDVLDSRYELQDLVTEKLGASTWRAHDTILARNVGIEMIPSDDPRAEHFLDAARASTAVTDPRFLRVLDLVEGDHDHHLVVREWARAFPLDQLLLQSPLPNRRATAVVAEVAEALAHAHEKNVFHRRLTPHHVLLKQTGAVRIVGLGVATALRAPGPPGHRRGPAGVRADGRRGAGAAPLRLPREPLARRPRRRPPGRARGARPAAAAAPGARRGLPRRRRGVRPDPRASARAPPHAAAHVGRQSPGRCASPARDAEEVDDPSPLHISSPDLLRLDPVIVPAGPPPGLEPPRRRPKAFEPAPPTTFERGVTRARRAASGGARKMVIAGIAGAVALAAVLAFLVGRTTGDVPGLLDDGDDPAVAAEVERLPIDDVSDFDPQGQDGEENPDLVELATDGDPDNRLADQHLLQP